MDSSYEDSFDKPNVTKNDPTLKNQGIALFSFITPQSYKITREVKDEDGETVLDDEGRPKFETKIPEDKKNSYYIKCRGVFPDTKAGNAAADERINKLSNFDGQKLDIYKGYVGSWHPITGDPEDIADENIFDNPQLQEFYNKRKREQHDNKLEKLNKDLEDYDNSIEDEKKDFEHNKKEKIRKAIREKKEARRKNKAEKSNNDNTDDNVETNTDSYIENNIKNNNEKSTDNKKSRREHRTKLNKKFHSRKKTNNLGEKDKDDINDLKERLQNLGKDD